MVQLSIYFFISVWYNVTKSYNKNHNIMACNTNKYRGGVIMVYYAHSENKLGEWEPLDRHLYKVFFRERFSISVHIDVKL